jgi:heme ABC exporter ATP-binding subunit CcmA
MPRPQEAICAPAVEVAGLEQRYGYRRALSDVSLRIEAGELVLVLGQNGAGKSTLLKVLATLSRPRAGRVLVLGHALPREADLLRRRLGYLGHEAQIYPGLSALENLRFAARLHGRRPTDAALLARLDEVGLGPVALQEARSYSRGMLQRLALVRSVLHEPELVLFDEPFTGLDTPGRAYVLLLLQRLRREGRTVVLTTHQIEEVYPLATRVLLLGRGRVQLHCPREAVTLDEVEARLAGRAGVPEASCST